MDLQTPVNERAQIGGNNPPDDKRTELTQLIKEAIAAASAWVNEIGEITDKANADRAADFKRQLRDLRKRADEQRAAEKKPHDDAAKAIQEFWRSPMASTETAEKLMDQKIKGYLDREAERIRKEQEEARRKAEEAEEAAAREMDRAQELLAKAERGELAGTGVNTVAQLEIAQQAAEEAARIKKEAEAKLKAKAGAGGNNTIGGVKRTVTVRKREVVVLDLPSTENLTKAKKSKVIVAALQKIIPFIEEHGGSADLRAEIGRLVNAIYREKKLVAPGCKIIIDEKVV